MKKNTDDKLEYERIKRWQRERSDWRARCSKSEIKCRGKLSPNLILAPHIIDIYKDVNHRKTTEFLQQIRLACKRKGRVVLCFRNTKKITAAAGILILAEVERLTSRFGVNKFSINRPSSNRTGYGQVDNTVDAILHQIGLYKAIGMNRAPNYGPMPMVDCWQVRSGDVVKSETAGMMLKALRDKLRAQTGRTLYRGAIEALANSVEHAYSGIRADGLGIDDRRWWMFTAQIDCRLVVLVCDLGVGIPNTIRETQSENILDLIFRLFRFEANTDAGWIKTATLVKETRTNAGHRGKGGSDLRQLVKDDDTAVLSIFSNRGRYRHSAIKKRGNGENIATPEILMNHRNSILGTIVEWSIEVA